jgi:hypothetical protein
MQEIHGHSDKVPGEDPSLKSKMLCYGSSVMGKFTPINQICDHVVAFHCYSEDVKRQVIAHHYCNVINEDFRQCIIYDSDKADAKLIGVEYIISEKLFKDLPEEEKKYWHSHVYEIKAGILTAPEVPTIAEKEVMKKLISTYGKTIHFWQIDRGDVLPLGEPKLMMSYVNEKMVDWDLVKKRDELLGLDYKEIAKSREDIVEPIVDPGADQWTKTNKGINFKAENVDLKL